MPILCKYCGNNIDNMTWVPSCSKEYLIENKVCFICRNYYNMEIDDNIVIINNNIFEINQNEDNRGFLIHFKDGRKVHSDYLIHRGEIPQYFKYKFKENVYRIEGYLWD